MNLIDICRIANISYKDKLDISNLLRQVGAEVYSLNELYEYRYVYFIIDRTLYISIRGSYTLGNWLKNTTGNSIDEGFEKILHHISNKYVVFSSLVNSVVVTGHSLGGSIAIKIANYFKDTNDNIDVKCVAFSPMKPYKIKYKNKADVLYFTAEGDFANLYPFRNKIYGREVYFDKDNNVNKPKSKLIGLIKGLFRKGYGIIESHKIEILLANLMKNETKLIELGLWEV